MNKIEKIKKLEKERLERLKFLDKIYKEVQLRSKEVRYMCFSQDNLIREF